MKDSLVPCFFSNTYKETAIHAGREKKKSCHYLSKIKAIFKSRPCLYMIVSYFCNRFPRETLGEPPLDMLRPGWVEL